MQMKLKPLKEKINLTAVVREIFSKTDKRLNKTEGVIMFLVFACYYAYVLLT